MAWTTLMSAACGVDDRPAITAVGDPTVETTSISTRPTTPSPEDDADAPPDTTTGRGSSPLVDVPSITGVGEIPADWETFTDPSGVSFRHPPDWETAEGTAGPIIAYVDPPTTPRFRRNINITKMTSVQGTDLESYNEISLNELDGLAGASRGELLAATISGEPAGQLTYQVSTQGLIVRALGVWVARPDGIWLITYTSLPARFDDAAGEASLVMSTVRLPA